MGKVKQRFNAKARSKVGKGNQDAKQNTHTGVNQRNGPPLIESGMDSDQYHSVLEPNPEIVVVDKLKKEKKHAAIEGKERKILSKKKQKQFDKIMEKKKKKLKVFLSQLFLPIRTVFGLDFLHLFISYFWWTTDDN